MAPITVAMTLLFLTVANAETPVSSVLQAHGLSMSSAVEPRYMENLARGVIAINQGGGHVYIAWRLLGTDPDDIAFNLYRSIGGGDPVRLNNPPIKESTNFIDAGVNLGQSNSYFVRPVLNGREYAASAAFTLQADAPAQQYISIPLETWTAMVSMRLSYTKRE